MRDGAIEADLQEEANEQQIGDAHQRFADLFGLWVRANENADKQCAEIGFESDGLETLRTEDERKEKAAKGDHFPVTRAGDKRTNVAAPAEQHH